MLAEIFLWVTARLRGMIYNRAMHESEKKFLEFSYLLHKLRSQERVTVPNVL